MDTSVLIVGDNPDSLHVWSYALERRGIESAVVHTRDVMEWNENRTCYAILFDVHSPGYNYLSLVQDLRRATSIPILLMLTTQEESELLEAYDTGVDECIEKPIGPELLVAKVRSWLARVWTVQSSSLDRYQRGQFSLKPIPRHLQVADGEPIELTALEFRVLHVLMANAGQALDTDSLVARVWGYIGDKDSAVLLRNLIYRLRRKVEPDPSTPRFIQTVPNVGYIFYLE